MTLQAYWRNRSSRRIPEPRPNRGERTFVMQKHAASRPHYDFRLELDGVLLSWSVPQGPTLHAGEKRLAMRTGNHPLAHATFEGTIPPSEYGGGAVIVWDRGSWRPDGDPRQGLARGQLGFFLEGEKLRGRWHLVRTHKGGTGPGAPRERWLLVKADDEAAREGKEIVETAPASVVTGRLIEEVAEGAAGSPRRA